jgi:hypothetical protein
VATVSKTYVIGILLVSKLAAGGNRDIDRFFRGRFFGLFV